MADRRQPTPPPRDQIKPSPPPAPPRKRVPLIKTTHTTETLTLALARQQRFFERARPPLRMAKAKLHG